MAPAAIQNMPKSGSFVISSTTSERSLRGRWLVRLQTLQQHLLSRTGTGWSGLAIDAQEEFAADYAKYRPRTRFFAFFVSDSSDGLESLFVPDGNRLVSSSNKEFSDRYDASGKERKVKTITLDDLLVRTGVTKIDFLTMDIELAEPKALAGFDLVRHRPRLVCVEAHPDVRQHLINYFADRQYRVVGRYLRADPYNLWFAPADSALPGGVHVADVH